MRNTYITIVTVFAICSAGCSKSDDNDSGAGNDGISGIYSVTSQLKNTESCEGEGTADPTAPDFYRIFTNSEIFPGTPGWSSEKCTTVEECKDDDLHLADIVFSNQSEGTWNGESIITAFGGTSCSVSITASVGGTQADGSTLITQTVHRGMKELSQADCDPDSPALTDRSFLNCTETTKIILARVP